MTSVYAVKVNENDVWATESMKFNNLFSPLSKTKFIISIIIRNYIELRFGNIIFLIRSNMK